MQSSEPSTSGASLERMLADTGYAFVHASTMSDLLTAVGPLADWRAFASSWDHLDVDAYLVNGERYRRRRFAVYRIAPDGSIERQAHQPHFQHVEYNRLFGGVERWFSPIGDDIGAGPTMTTVLRFCDRLFSDLSAAAPNGARPDRNAWHVEVHQFRIEARAEAPGRPTPEGVHRDGVDYVLVLLVNRENIISGTTTVYDLDGRALGSFTLTDPLDAALVDDARVAHGVTPVGPLDSSRPGHRDVLVVTFRRVPGSR